MPYNPFEGFQVGQKAGKANRSTMGMTSDSLLDQFNKSSESNREISKLKALEDYKTNLSSPLEQAQIKNYESLSELRKGGKGVFLINPLTGETTQTGTSVPYGSKVFKQETPTGVEATTLSDIDEVLKTIPGMRASLQKNPSLSATGRIPFVNPSYKSDYDYLTKTIASVVGGKNLTLPERKIVQTNLPSTQDMFDAPTLQKKLDRIERVMAGAKARLAGGQFSEQSGVADSDSYNSELRDAMDAIKKGAPGQLVAERFKRNTGRNLDING